MGFTVLAFPCNDFGGQEPGSPAEIRTFCTENYEVDFPIFAKLQTKEGDGQSELYSLLGTKTGDLPGWNFGKYLISADGTPLGFYSSRTSPSDPDLRAAILAASPDAREIGAREDAIFEAVRGLAAGDIAVIAGKGHEQGQIIGADVIPFDDLDVAFRAASEADR